MKYRKKISELLEKLPVYSPEKRVWDNIADELDNKEKDKIWREKLVDLPEYEPTDNVWNAIKTELDKGDTKIISITHRMKWLAAASIVGILFIAGLFILKSHDTEKMTLSHTEEIIENDIFLEDWNDDEMVFDDALKMCETKPDICKTPEFLELKSELTELNDAKSKLIEAMEYYGKDSDLIAQLAKIELERTKVCKKIFSI